MKIFADAGIREVLASLVAGIADQDATIVQLEQKGKENAHLSDSIGLKIAIDAAKEGSPVVMLGWMPRRMYIERKPQEWFAAIGHPNIVFVTLPGSPEEIAKAIEEAKAGTRCADPLAIALLGVEQTNKTVNILHHDLFHAERDAERMARWVERARAVFGDKPGEELAALVKNARAGEGLPGPLEGQVFPDVCVDVEGTLLTTEGRLRPEVLTLAEEKANGGPITIWTGGEIFSLTRQLREAGAPYKIAAKDVMKSTTVRVVIDDTPQEDFESTYGIRCQEYVKV